MAGRVDRKGKQLLLYSLFAMAAFVLPLYSEPVIPKSVEHSNHSEDAAAVVIDAERIERSGAKSITELLSMEGFYVTEEQAGSEARVTIAGLTAQNIHVYIDGVLQNNASYGRFDFSSLDLSRVESITIYQAGFCPLPYAGSFSGAVIAIQTRGAAMPRTQADVCALSYSGSALDTQKISVLHEGIVQGTGGKKQGAEVSYKAAAALSRAKNDYRGMDNADAMLSNAQAGAAVQLQKVRITADYSLYHNDINVPPQTGQAGEEESTAHAVVLGADGNAGGCAIRGAAHYRHEKAEYEAAEDEEEDVHKLDTISFNASLTTPLLGAFKASLSTRQGADILRSTASGNHTRWSGFEKGVVTITPFTALPCPAIAFDAGVTLDHYGENAAINPFCAIRFDALPLSVSLCYARLYQEPTMEQLYWKGGSISGNRCLDAERGNAWTLFAKCSFAPCPLSFSLTYMDMKDKIRYMEGTFKNVSRAHIWTLETRAAPTMRVKGNLFAMNVAYTLTSAKIAGGAQDGNQIMDVPLHTFTALLTYKARYTLTGINLEYASKRYVSNWNGEANSSYFMLGAFAALDIPLGMGKSISPYIKAQNITDRHVWSDYTRTIHRPPRAIVCGAKLEV